VSNHQIHVRFLHRRHLSFFKFSIRCPILKSMAVSHFLKSTSTDVCPNQIHYDVTGKNNNVSFVSLDILSLIMSVSPSNCHYSKYISGSSWLWSYGSWIYNYLCNQFQSPLKLWVQIPLMARCTQYNIMWLSLSVTCGRSVVFSRYSHFLHQSNWLPWYNWNIVESG
jgi:hypothetical protein